MCLRLSDWKPDIFDTNKCFKIFGITDGVVHSPFMTEFVFELGKPSVASGGAPVKFGSTGKRKAVVETLWLGNDYIYSNAFHCFYGEQDGVVAAMKFWTNPYLRKVNDRLELRQVTIQPKDVIGYSMTSYWPGAYGLRDIAVRKLIPSSLMNTFNIGQSGYWEES